MKINSKPTRIKLFLLKRGLLALLTAVTFFFVSSSVSFAPTKIMDTSTLSKTKSINFAEKRLMSDAELSDTNAQAFFNLVQTSNQYGSQNVITLNLGATVQILAHLDSFKIGYYNYTADYGHGNPNGYGWDYDVTNYYWGGSNQYTSSSATPLIFNGVFLQVGFDNISSATQRKLNYIDFGTTNASGPITGTFNVLNALTSNASTGQNNGVMIRQTLAKRENITFNNEPLTFLFATKYNFTDDAGHTTNNLEGFFQKIPKQTISDLGY